MPTTTEPDLELLDAHLDDALSPIDAEHLRLRLAAEPELAAALRAMRGDRATRAAVWQAMEPSDPDARAAGEQALRRIRAAEWGRRALRVTAGLAAAAACFAAGWFGRPAAESDRDRDRDLASAPPDAVRRAAPADRAAPGTFRVALTDAAGNVLAVQTFSERDEARRFAADLVAWQAQQQQPPSAPRQGQMLLISDEF